MDHNLYLRLFKSALEKADKRAFERHGICLFTGIVLDSVALKGYKPEWSNDIQNPLTVESRIFFSIWLNDKSIAENKLYYNIHAFKLRRLKGYKIQSRDFAERFRSQFAKQIKEWPNAGVEYGPLTLMQGWVALNLSSLENDIIHLLQKFSSIAPIINETLSQYRI